MSRAQLRVIEHARIQSEIRKNDAEAKKMEAESRYFDILSIEEHEKIQSEVKRNEAEAEKMEAEGKHFDRSRIRFFLKYGIAGIILVPAAIHLYLDTFKVLYDIKSYKIQYLEDKKKEIEKHYLEVMIKDASVNAYGAYMELIMQKNYSDSKSRYDSARAQYSYSQASQLLHEYWNLVTRIAETKEELFSEAKQGIAAKECRTQNGTLPLSPIRCKSLDLIERHVLDVRAGHDQFPADLISTFIEQPEFQ